MCTNTLHMTGTKGAIEDFLRENRGEYAISFTKAVSPVHETPFVMNKQWRIAHWGTVSDIDTKDTRMYQFSFSNSTFVIGFETEWTPPEYWLHAIAKKYPDIEFALYYEEPDFHFRGEIMMKGGKVISYIHETEYSYESDDDEPDSVG
jgi:hypothetical protein